MSMVLDVLAVLIVFSAAIWIAFSIYENFEFSSFVFLVEYFVALSLAALVIWSVHRVSTIAGMVSP